MKRTRFHIYLDILNAVKDLTDKPPYGGATGYVIRARCRSAIKDKYLQSLASKGFIEAEAKGSKLLWRLTPKGRELRDKLEVFLREFG